MYFKPRQRLELGEAEHRAALAAHAGLQQLVAPQRLARGLAGAGDGLVGLLRRHALVQRQDGRRRHRLDREGPADAQLGFVDARLVVERLLLGMVGDGLVHAALHRLPGGVEGVEGRAGGLGPVVRPVEGHLPFVQGVALGEVHRLALAHALRGLERLRRGGGSAAFRSASAAAIFGWSSS
jgi:hypothetical protein